jgi:preprotein translocase subunit SecA
MQALGVAADATSVDHLEELGGTEAITEHLQDEVVAELKKREAEHGAETWALVERLVLLRTIDSLWVEHLTELDDMRRGIGLRGYSGTDPLNEFKREAFTLYEELRGFIRRQVASTIFRVSVTKSGENPPHGAPGHVHENPPHGQPGHVHETSASDDGAAARQVAGEIGRGATRPVSGVDGSGNGSSDGSGNGVAEAPSGTPARQPLVRGLAGGVARPGTVREQLGDDPFQGQGSASSAGQPSTAPKVGRNDPCYCGSGLKYKKCHGR